MPCYRALQSVWFSEIALILDLSIVGSRASKRGVYVSAGRPKRTHFHAWVEFPSTESYLHMRSVEVYNESAGSVSLFMCLMDGRGNVVYQ